MALPQAAAIPVIHLFLNCAAQRKASLTAKFEYEGVPCEMTFGPRTTVLFAASADAEFQRRDAHKHVKFQSVCDPHPLFVAVRDAFLKQLREERAADAAAEAEKEERRRNTPCVSCRELHPDLVLCPRTYCTSCSRMFYLCTCDW